MSRHTRRDTINGGAQGAQSSESKRHALTARGLLALPLLLALALSSLVVVAAPQPVGAAEVFTVNTLSDNVAAADGGQCGTGGSCSLRGAILEANATAGIDTIRFEIGGSAPFVIAPGSPLPAVTDTVIIDGRNKAIGPDVNTPIRLDGAGAGPSATGLDLSGSTGSEVSGFSIGRFEVGVLAGSNATIRGNFIGTDQTGAAGFGNGYGVRIQNASDVVVGGTTPGGADLNVIASNFVGVQITLNSDDNRILGNYIGTDPTGTAPLGNDFGISIQPFDEFDTALSERNEIGNGTGPGRNVISGNGREGIQLWDNAVGTVIRDNFIGVSGAVGQLPLGNNQSGPDTGAFGGVGGFNWGGIVLRNGASDNFIGGPGPSDANTIANNNNGVVAFSGTGNTIANNSMSGNLDRGIVLFDADVNDPGDLDGGANLGQNQPVVTSASIEAPNQLSVEFSVDTINPGSGVYPIVVDFYEADSGASGEGQRTLQGRFSIDDPGSYSTIIGFAGTQIEVGDPIVAIATDAAGNSSTFSHVAVVGGGDALASSEAGERFGASVALDGNRMAVSAPFADVAGVNGGVVRVYDRTDEAGPWVLTGVIATPNPEVDGGFGDSLDLRGDLIAIGESDRFGDEGEGGVVWVFSFNGFTWDPVGEAIQQPSPTAGDRFGTDLAWIDDSNLAIGAPGVAADSGSVFVATLSAAIGPWTLNDLSSSVPEGFEPATGDEFGYSIAYDDSTSGVGTLIVGAPGNDFSFPSVQNDGSIYRFQRNGGSFDWTSRLTGFNPDSAMGTSVEISGNRHVAGGYGTGSLEVGAYDFNGSWAEAGGKIFTAGGVPTAGDGQVNDYLAIDGRTIAVGRGGAGGSVELFTIGDTWPSGLPTLIAPSTREAGDRIGWSLGLEGRTLLAGAPGDDGTSNAALDAGAIYSIGVPIVSTWTGASPAATNLWSDPQNWALGAVPEPGGAVIVPPGEVVDVDVDVELSRFVMESGSFVGVGDGRVFTSSDTTLLGSSELVAQPGGEIVFRNRAEIDSFFIARNGDFSGLPNGVLTLDGDVIVTGTGEIDVPGTVRKTGGGIATVDVLDFPTPLSGWLSSSGSQIEVAEGVLEIDGADLDNGELVGEVLVAAGAQFRVNGNVILTPATSIGVEIDGTATTTGNYGRIDVTGTLNKAGELFINETDLVVGNSYPVISCDDCLPGDFFSVPEGLDIQVDPQVISVSANPCDTEWTGAAGNGFWLTAANWTNGVPTSGDVVCLDGTGDVTIGEDTSAAVDRFEIADQRIIIDGTLDVNNTSFLNQGVEVNGILTAIGDVVLRGNSVVSGFLDGLVSVENGATLEFAGGASVIATAPVNDFINDGMISVTATDLLLGDGVSVFNNGVWAWTADQPQRVVTSGTATIVNPAQIELSDQPVDLGPGIALEFGGGSVLTTSILSSSAAGQFGSLAAEGTVTVTPGAALIVELDPILPYSPTIFDRYEIIDCGAADCALFTNVTLPAGLEQLLIGGNIELGLAAANPTFVDNTGDGLWGTAANWTTGLVPGADDIAEIPSGVTALVTGVFDVGALDVAGQLDVGETSTLNVTGGPAASLPTTVRSSGSLTVLSPDTLNIAASSVVVEGGGQFAVGTDARVVFNGTAPQVMSGSGQVINDGVIRNENLSSVVIEGSLDYVDGLDSRVEIEGGRLAYGPSTLGLTSVQIAPEAVLELTSALATADGDFFVGGALAATSATLAGSIDVASATLEGSLTVAENGSMDISGTSEIRGDVFIDNGGQATFADDTSISGSVTNLGQVDVQDSTTLTGGGTWSNEGQFRGAVGVTVDVQWESTRASIVSVPSESDLTFTSGFEEFGLVLVNEDGRLLYEGAMVFDEDSILDVEITGPSTSSGNYGRVSFANVVPQFDSGATLRTDPFAAEYNPEPSDEYPVVLCELGCPLFPETETAPLVQSIVDGDIVLALPTSDYSPVVDIDGDTAVVAVPSQGTVFVLDRSAGVWSDTQTIDSPDPGYSDFGASVSLALPYLAVGAPDSDAVEVYEFDGSAFVALRTYNGQAGSLFGASLSVADGRLAVGAPLYDAVATDVGAVDLFVLAAPTTIPDRRISDGSDGDRFGSTVAITEADLWVAALGDDGPTDSDPETGLVRRYDVGGTFANAELRAPGQGTGGTISAVSGRAAIGTAVSTSVLVFDTGFGERTIAGASTGFGNQLALVGDRLYTDDEGTSVASVFDLNTATNQFVLSGLLPSAIGTVSLAADGASVVRGIFGTGSLSSGLDAVVFSQLSLPDTEVETPTFGAFELSASASEVSVAPTGIATSAIPSRNASGATGQTDSVASTSLVGLDLNTPVGSNVAASPVASLTIGESVLAAIDGASSLDRLPLTDIDVTVPILNTDPPQVGGWEEILRRIGDPVLLSRPPQNIQFGEVKDFPQVEQLRLDQLSLAGTPVASLPVASLVLGSTPVASLDTDVDWCEEIAATGSSANCSTGIDPTQATLVELTLAGIPVASLPVASLPVASLPVASLPVASLPVASLDLASTPVASLPVASLPVASLPVASLPVASLPVASLQVETVDAAGNLVSLPVASLPVASLPVASLPVASLPVASLPVASLDTSGTVLADFADSANPSLVSIPVASLDLVSSPVASLPVASLDLASLPVASLPVASLPVASLPVASLPVASLDVSGTPVASLTTDGTLATLPVASLPVASLPVASLPVASLPVASLPVASLPVASLPVASLPVASLPVASLPVASLPVASLDLASLPVASLPVASLPVASLRAVVDCGAVDVDCSSTTLSLAEALAIAPVANATFEDLAPLLAGLRWSEVLPVLSLTETEFVQILIDLDNAFGETFTLSDVVTEGGGFGDLTVGELPTIVLQQLFLGDIAPYLDGVRLGDLVGNILDFDGNPLDPVAVEAALTAAKNRLTLQLVDLTDFDDLTLGDLVDEAGNPLLQGLTLGEVAPYLTGLRFDDLLTSFPGLSEDDVRGALEDILAASDLQLGQLLVGDLTFDDLLASDEFGQLTLEQLLTAILAENEDALDGITLGDLLLAFVAPSDYPWDAIVFDDIDPADLPGLVGAVTFDASFELTGTTRGQSVELTVALPDTAGYLPGTSALNGAPLAEPTVVGNVLTWRLTGLAPDIPYTLSFDLQPTLELGSSTVDVEARIVGVAGGTVTAASSVSVRQAFEPNNTPETAAPLAEDTIYINHVASADDLDYFKIAVTDGQRLVVNLSNLAADFDVVVYGRSQSSTIVPLVPPSGQSAGTPTPDPIIEPDGTTQVQTELTGAATSFDGLPVVATGNRRGTETETVVTPPLGAGTVYVKVFGANGESSVRAAVLQAEVTEGTTVPECLPLTQRFADGIPGTSSIPANANTLFLVNQERLSALYPDSYTQVFDRLDDLVGFLNGTDGGNGADLGIVPGVLDVGLVADYATWDAEPCNSAKANGVVAEITDEITELRRTRDIEHIVVIGGDDIVPHARVTDGAEISNEFDYRFTFSGNNAIAGSAWDRQILTDEPYGDTAALDFGDRYLYITDTALGRLVDTPSDIAFQLDQFVTSQGLLNPTTGLVVGYDFLDDGSEAIAADLRGALDVDNDFGSFDDNDTWNADDLAGKLFPTTPAGAQTPDVISLNAHFDHRRALPALDNTNKTEVDLFEATTVFASAPNALTGRITFSMGCHSGLAVSDATIGVLSDDFAQGFTFQGGIYVGNTGYGYGDTETVAYSERLMELFADELVNPIQFDRTTTAGQALQFAKNTFFSELGNVSVYDEKALMEATFYGLPFYRLSLEPEAPAPTPTTTTQIDPITGSPVATFTVTPDNEEVPRAVDGDGTKFVNRSETGDPLELKSPFNPAQPLELVDVSVVDPTDPTSLDLVARGAIVTGLNSTYLPDVDPIIVRPVADDSATQSEPAVGDVVFPIRPTAIRTTSQAEGERQTLALATGQFRGSSTNGVQRLDNELEVAVYYAEESETDFTAPLVGVVDSFVVDGQLSISVDVSDAGGAGDAGTGVDRVYVLVAENPGVDTVEWRGVELTEDQARPGRWVGSLLLSPGADDVQLFVQAKDGAGNVGVSSNKGENFGAVPVEEPPAPPAGVEVTIGGEPSADVPVADWFDTEVTVTVTAGELPVEYRLRNGPITPFPDDGLVIDAEGASRLVVTVGGDPVLDRVIRIDRTPPAVRIASPIDDSTFVVGKPLVASLTCSDASLVSCIATLDGEGISSNEDLSGLTPGVYEIEVIAQDATGRTASATSTFTVIGQQTAPEITLVDGPRAPQLINDGFMVDIEFNDADFGRDDYTVTIDWGDGDEDTPGTSTICVVSSTGGAVPDNPSCEILASPSADGPGLAVGSFEYSAPGVYPITVTVDDGTASDTSVFQFATIYDPGAGRVSGAGLYWSGREAYDGSRRGSTAIFGYNARYKGDDPVPRGKTKLHLLGEFLFKSTSYDYLIINDTFAVAEGTGKFNGRSGYDFRVQGIDSGWLDFFQLTIWDPDGEVVYDNGVKYDNGQLVEAPEGDRVLLGGIRIRR